jgi:hypothetical protein
MVRLAAAVMMAIWLGGCLAPVESLPSDVQPAVERQLARADLSYARFAASPDFIRRVAFSSAGASDWVIDYNEARGPYCGTGGCPLQVWVKGSNGAYRLAFDQQVLGWRARTEAGATTLAVRLHGALCGRSAIEICAQSFRWTGGAGDRGAFTPSRGEGSGPLAQAIRLNPDETPTPVRYAVKAYEASCMRAGGSPEMGQSVQSLPDLNGDGAREMLFNAATAWCWTKDGVAPVRPDCKAGSCNSRLFSRKGDDWREVLAAPHLRYEIEYERAGPVMKVDGRPLRWTS